MKYLILTFCFLVFGVSAKAQSIANLKLIDSLHQEFQSSKSKDSLRAADYYYNLGEVYRYSFKYDSAYPYYYKAEKIYKGLKEKLRSARTLYGIADIQRDEKDYTGSEVTSFEALALLEDLSSTYLVEKYKSFTYNNLGIIYNQLGQRDESIAYYDKALKLKLSLEGDNLATINITRGNLANVYRDLKKYKEALNIYNDILANKNLKERTPDVYVTVLGNYAHTLELMGDTKQLPKLYLDALKLADSLQDRSYDAIIIHQRLAEFYNKRGMQDSALYHAYKAKDISEDYFNDDILKSLKILAEIETGEKATKFLKDYIALSDSIQKQERATRNKFARIRFETDQVEQENIRISRERSWLFVISIVILMTSVLVYIVIMQRNKNKELKFAQEQQEANEEIYNLMLSQNESVEEARALEKKRISQELHDGVLGRLFGTRLSLDSLNFNNTPEAIKTRAEYISGLKTIEEDIRKVSHELNTDFVSGSGFIDIIKTFVETQSVAYNLQYSLDYNETINWDVVPNKTKIHIYRIMQEALHNIYKHAQASSVKIRFKLKNNVICLKVVDNGVGFDVNKSKSGIGLKNMNSRLAEIDGKVRISSEKEKGTKVKIEIPIA